LKSFKNHRYLKSSHRAVLLENFDLIKIYQIIQDINYYDEYTDIDQRLDKAVSST